MAKTPAHHNKKGEKLEAFGKTCQILFFFPLFSFFASPRSLLVFYAGNMEAVGEEGLSLFQQPE